MSQAQKLTRLEQAEAANALVQWFNSQEIVQVDAAAIMRYAQARLFVAENRKDVFALQEALHDFQLQFVHEVNERIHKNARDSRR